MKDFKKLANVSQGAEIHLYTVHFIPGLVSTINSLNTNCLLKKGDPKLVCIFITSAVAAYFLGPQHHSFGTKGKTPLLDEMDLDELTELLIYVFGIAFLISCLYYLRLYLDTIAKPRLYEGHQEYIKETYPRCKEFIEIDGQKFLTRWQHKAQGRKRNGGRQGQSMRNQ